MDRSELQVILEKFSVCGWELLSVPADAYLKGQGSKEDLIDAVKKADAQCGSCGCEMDAMYKTVLCHADLL